MLYTMLLLLLLLLLISKTTSNKGGSRIEIKFLLKKGCLGTANTDTLTRAIGTASELAHPGLLACLETGERNEAPS